MASVALSNISNVTRGITGNKGSGLNIGGIPIECFRIAAGQLSGDTAVLTPVMPNIRAVYGPVTHNLPTSGSGASSVTVTLSGVFTSAVSNTIGAVDVWVVGPQVFP